MTTVAQAGILVQCETIIHIASSFQPLQNKDGKTSESIRRMLLNQDMNRLIENKNDQESTNSKI